MLNTPKTPLKRRKNEAEKPFWISFADLMTALMVLFLVAMAVALLSVTEGLRQQDDQRVQRDKGISTCLQDIAQMTQEKSLAGVQLRGQTLELGTLAEFPKDSHQLDAQRADFLRDFVPKMLDVARTPACQMWLKRFVLEGYASPEGSYLYNLNLSLARSQRVLCVLLDDTAAKAPRQSDRQAVRDMFFVGGSSFNSAILNQPEKSRRVELRLEFKELDPSCSASGACAAMPAKPIPWDDDVKCPLATR
ncbi:flagellar motor protein MotB [Limnohabitans sp. Rim8]|uniref:flagellar motor protein MotB n=1 Tax=Limnohabitans sp. Rim8 TaxID=1100718 RepID=UPI002612D132|nr:flagellar motor protein MotB [Limnohabitans sp. Rim8]